MEAIDNKRDETKTNIWTQVAALEAPGGHFVSRPSLEEAVKFL